LKYSELFEVVDQDSLHLYVKFSIGVAPLREGQEWYPAKGQGGGCGAAEAAGESYRQRLQPPALPMRSTSG